jgi:hypothetical protein
MDKQNKALPTVRPEPQSFKPTYCYSALYSTSRVTVILLYGHKYLKFVY